MIYLIREHTDNLNCYRLGEYWQNLNFLFPFNDLNNETLKKYTKTISFEEYLNHPKTTDDSFFYELNISNPFSSFDVDYNILDYVDNKDIIPHLQSGQLQILVLMGVEEWDIFRLGDYNNVAEKDLKNYYFGTIFGTMEKYLTKYDIPTEFFHYASPLTDYDYFLGELDKLGLYTNKMRFYHYDSYLQQYINLTKIYNPICNLSFDNLYCCLAAGTLKKHRTDMVYSLWKNDLLKQGKTSLSHIFDGDYEEEFKSLIPLKVDGNINVHQRNNENRTIEIETDILKDILLYISCETHLESNVCYITEKTWRAILHKKPFLIVGDNGSLDKLKKMGFKTFDKWWSEDYDYWNDERTIEYVTSVIKKLSKKTLQEREEWFNACGDIQEVLDHNYKTLGSLDKMIPEFLSELHKNYQATSP